MSTTGDILRAVAAGIPKDEPIKGKSRYICDMIFGIESKYLDDKFTQGQKLKAKLFLFRLGMGASMTEFSEFLDGKERQFVRVTFLLFAADLADEWSEE
jgi:hypothetical protein